MNKANWVTETCMKYWMKNDWNKPGTADWICMNAYYTPKCVSISYNLTKEEEYLYGCEACWHFILQEPNTKKK